MACRLLLPSSISGLDGARFVAGDPASTGLRTGALWSSSLTLEKNNTTLNLVLLLDSLDKILQVYLHKYTQKQTAYLPLHKQIIAIKALLLQL